MKNFLSSSRTKELDKDCNLAEAECVLINLSHDTKRCVYSFSSILTTV